MDYENFTTLSVTIEQGVAVITFDNGEINLFDLPLISDLERASRQVEADPAVRVMVLQSANPEFFIAHADLAVINRMSDDPTLRNQTLGAFRAMLDRFRTMQKPTIAKIAGRCRGGGMELALACDMRFGALGEAVFCQPEVGIGILPGGGGSVRLPRLVGRGRALEIILGCADFNAELAERYGIINRALPANELDGFVASLASRIAGFPPEAVALAKDAASMDDAGIEAQLAREGEYFLQAVDTAPAKRRIAAALAGGMQTAELERRCFTHIWSALAGI